MAEETTYDILQEELNKIEQNLDPEVANKIFKRLAEITEEINSNKTNYTGNDIYNEYKNIFEKIIQEQENQPVIQFQTAQETKNENKNNENNFGYERLSDVPTPIEVINESVKRNQERYLNETKSTRNNIVKEITQTPQETRAFFRNLYEQPVINVFKAINTKSEEILKEATDKAIEYTEKTNTEIRKFKNDAYSKMKQGAGIVAKNAILALAGCPIERFKMKPLPALSLNVDLNFDVKLPKYDCGKLNKDLNKLFGNKFAKEKTNRQPVLDEQFSSQSEIVEAYDYDSLSEQARREATSQINGDDSKAFKKQKALFEIQKNSDSQYQKIINDIPLNQKTFKVYDSSPINIDKKNTTTILKNNIALKNQSEIGGIWLFKENYGFNDLFQMEFIPFQFMPSSVEMSKAAVYAAKQIMGRNTPLQTYTYGEARGITLETRYYATKRDKNKNGLPWASNETDKMAKHDFMGYTPNMLNRIEAAYQSLNLPFNSEKNGFIFPPPVIEVHLGDILKRNVINRNVESVNNAAGMYEGLYKKVGHTRATGTKFEYRTWIVTNVNINRNFEEDPILIENNVLKNTMTFVVTLELLEVMPSLKFVEADFLDYWRHYENVDKRWLTEPPNRTAVATLPPPSSTQTEQKPKPKPKPKDKNKKRVNKRGNFCQIAYLRYKEAEKYANECLKAEQLIHGQGFSAATPPFIPFKSDPVKGNNSKVYKSVTSVAGKSAAETCAEQRRRWFTRMKDLINQMENKKCPNIPKNSTIVKLISGY